MVIFVYVCSTCSVDDLKTRFEKWIRRNNVNGANLIHLPYLVTLTAYLYSQWSPNIQITYFMCDWSNYRQFVINKAWKPNSLQKMIFVYVCSKCSVVELKTRFETKIKWRNLCKFASLSYLITLTAYLGLQWARKVQIKYFMFDWSIYRLYVLNRGWKRDTLQMMIFVYACSTCRELK
jgi:DNA-directed RNA polymerase subunit RPC12/RpoP